MLINWMSSSLQQTINEKNQNQTTHHNFNTTNDETINTNQLILHFCTNLLSAGVIKQIPDKYAPIQETFRVSFLIILFYYLCALFFVNKFSVLFMDVC